MFDCQSVARFAPAARASCYSGIAVRCLEENTLFEYVGDGLSAAVREEVALHAAGCESCRRMIAAAVGAAPSLHAAATEPQASTASALDPERLLAGKYRLLRLLGAGGMGVVHEAVNTWTGRHVAVKELHGSFSSDATAVQRFTLEAQSASRIAHPNVVDILDLGVDPATGTLFMVQELLTGSTLRHRIAERGKLSVEEVLRIARPALAALVVAHDAGVVHRDLKPDNIFLARDPAGREVPKLIDFGLSKQLRESGGLALTEHGRQLGTPFYMSPEQLRGETDLDDRTDVWSIGVVMFEAVAGARPFAGPSYNELVVQILKEPLPRLAEVAEGVPAAFSAVVQRALARDREHRPRAHELRDALDELARHPEVLQLPPGNPYRGILPFEADHRGVFFGRAADVAALVERLHRARFVLVAGDSGVGKSSLVRAGVLPVIRDRGGVVVTVTPGRDPVASLAAALAAILDDAPDGVGSALAVDPAVVGARLRAAERAAGLVVFVDQLEELLTLADGADAARATTALAALAGLGVEPPALRLIATVRSDFLARLSALPGLGDAVTGALYLLRPLSPDGVREAIVGPARIMGLHFESSALVDELVASAGSSAGELPLLQFALAELWEARDVERGMICAGSLASFGGVAGALARHADGVLAALPARQRPLVRRILTALVTDEGTRARRTADELGAAAAADDEPGATAAVLETLVQGRLVTVEDAGAAGAATYQIAHDFLVDGWDTLRGWRGGEVERSVARQRLQRSAAEWDRLGRPVDALWTERQLAEVAELEPRGLAAGEAAFLDRSRRAVRRRRHLRRALVLGVPILVGLGFAGARWIAHRHTADEVAQHVGRAEESLARAAGQIHQIDEQRTAAFTAFDHGRGAEGETAWAVALDGVTALDASYTLASEHLETALALDSSDRDVRRRFAALLRARAELAELTHQPILRDEQVQRMAMYDDDGTQRARWDAPTQLTIDSAPGGAAVTVQRYDRNRRLSVPTALGATPRLAASLAPGSYLLTLRIAGRPEVRAPVLVGRGERVQLAIPVPQRLPDGYVFVPPGRFLYGSADVEEIRRTMMNAQPLHATTTGGYLIGRQEVTFGDWLAFLRGLPAAERVQRRPHTVETVQAFPGAVLDIAEPRPGVFQLTIQPGSRRYTAEPGQPIRYARRDAAVQDWLRMPVSGISWGDALAYASWLDRTGKLPGARPCSEREWERAARGADDRVFPHGDRLAPADADLAETYGRLPEAFGPDEVGSHPASDSPFGVSDLAGNAWEWVASVSGNEQVALRGGSWYHNPAAARSNNREPSEPMVRDVTIGLRMCADPPRGDNR
jgi:formylglycine-generating enzyme required for sulfatase activity